MLTRLIIHDVVLIEKLDVAFKPGLNVFTGETGAGKSILLDALALALGERSESGLVRQSASQASVTAEFSLAPSHKALQLAEDQGLVVDESLILRRVVGKDGKSRAFINDQPVSIGLLKQFGGLLLEIHGQFETHGLLDASTHRGLLDAFADLGALRNKVSQAYTCWKDTQTKFQTAASESDRAKAEEEFLRASVKELEDLSPETGEADQLASRRTGLQHGEKIDDALRSAEHFLNGDRGSSHALAQAGKAVARVADKAPELKEILVLIDRATNEAAEASTQLNRFMRQRDAEPDALQRIEERLFALRAVARKHNVQVDQLVDLRTDLSARLALLTDQGDKLATLARQAEAFKIAYNKFASDLSERRKIGAASLEKAIAQELPPLKLERARFIVDLTPLPEDQYCADGIDRVMFLAMTNPGSLAGALHKVASGGELARFMLALKVVLSTAAPVPVLVFDEVDSGIGGATASAVGERLGRLAEGVQILVVTHSPQVAARGNHHLRVMKTLKNKVSVTQVVALSDAERREEIARMLAGSQVTDAARQAASSLLDDAEPGLPHPTVKKRARR